MMDYEAFKESLIRGLEETYGGKAEIIPQETLRTNGERYEGLLAVFGTGEENIPVIRLDELYGMYRGGEADINGCVEHARRFREEHGRSERMEAFSKVVRSWEYGKRNVYPLLLSTEENRELLGELAHTPVPGLDLSVAYMIREEGESGGRHEGQPEPDETLWNRPGGAAPSGHGEPERRRLRLPVPGEPAGGDGGGGRAGCGP